MPRPVIPLAHDYACTWCWIAFFQAARLEEELGVQFQWLPYELYPEGMFKPEPFPRPVIATRRPPTPSRVELALAASDVELPPVEKPPQMRTHNAHEAGEHARVEGVFSLFNQKMYRAYWEKGRDISRLDVLEELAEGVFPSVRTLMEAVESRAYADRIIPFDERAHATGVYSLPTFFVGEKRLAEQPTSVLRREIKAWLEAHGG